jgi:hypothetical protein
MTSRVNPSTHPSQQGGQSDQRQPNQQQPRQDDDRQQGDRREEKSDRNPR